MFLRFSGPSRTFLASFPGSLPYYTRPLTSSPTNSGAPVSGPLPLLNLVSGHAPSQTQFLFLLWHLSFLDHSVESVTPAHPCLSLSIPRCSENCLSMAVRFSFSFHCIPLPLGRYLCGHTDLDCCHSARASGILLNVLGTSFHLRSDCSVLLFTRTYLSLLLP